MKCILNATFILFCFLCNSQNKCGKALYTETFTNAGSFNYALNFDEQESIYTMDTENNDKEDKMTINGFMPDLTLPIVYYNRIENVLTFQEDVAFNKVIVDDNMCDLNWKLGAEKRKIGNFNCNKATINFRGVNYIAWYTTDIPVSYGPWKFRGLGGLIIEVYDENANFKAYLTQVKFIDDCKSKEVAINKNPLNNPIKWEEYVRLKNAEANNIESLFNSKMPRGTGGVGVTIEGFTKEKIN